MPWGRQSVRHAQHLVTPVAVVARKQRRDPLGLILRPGRDRENLEPSWLQLLDPAQHRRATRVALSERRQVLLELRAFASLFVSIAEFVQLSGHLILGPRDFLIHERVEAGPDRVGPLHHGG